MESGWWGNAIATVATCGGVGVFIDFWIKKRGQERVRDWMETWWLRLSYVRWGTLGRDEALFAVQVIEQFFGRRLFSRRRFVATALIFVLSFGFTFIECITQNFPVPWNILFSFNRLMVNNVIWLAMLFLLTAVSFSITRFAAARVGKFLNRRPYLNLIGMILLLYLQYAIFICFYFVMNGIQISLSANVQYLIENIRGITIIDVFGLILLSIKTTLGFIWNALILQPFVWRPISGIQLLAGC